MGHLPGGAFPDHPVYLAPLHVPPTHQASHWRLSCAPVPRVMAADAPRAARPPPTLKGLWESPPQSRFPYWGGFGFRLDALPRGQAPGARGTPPQSSLGAGTSCPHTEDRADQRDPAGTGPGPGSPCCPSSAPGGLGARHQLRPRRLRVSAAQPCATAHGRSGVARGAHARPGDHVRPAF